MASAGIFTLPRACLIRRICLTLRHAIQIDPIGA